MSGSINNNNIIGSGSDSIVLNMAEDQAQGQDGEFTVNVDGQQIGGVETVTASHSAGQTEPFTFEGNFAPGPHDVTVTFVNNFNYPGLTGDRNVYVEGVTYDGQTTSNTTTGIYQSPFFPPNSTTGNNYGNAVFQVNDTTPVPAGAPSTPTPTVAPASIGSGADTLVLNMSEDPWAGDAQFSVAVDGQQIGGVQTTTAVEGQGQYQEFDVHGNFGPGNHTVAVTFLNNATGGYYPPGTPGLPPGGPWALDSEDRNVYVMGASLDGGPAASGTPWEISSNGTEDFTVTAGSNPAATSTSSGLFATDGAPATSDNAAIPPTSLSGGTSNDGSSSGMAFIASPSTPSPTPTPTPTPTTSSTSTTGDITPAMTTAVTQTTQDFSVPSTASSSGGDTTTSHSGSSGHLWMTHAHSGNFGSAFHSHG